MKSDRVLTYDIEKSYFFLKSYQKYVESSFYTCRKIARF